MIRTTLAGHGGGHTICQGAADRAVTDGWNAHGAGDLPSANPWLTDQPEYNFWRSGWLTRNRMCARNESGELILYVAVSPSRASAGRRSTIEATVRSAGSRATDRLTARGFAAESTESHAGDALRYLRHGLTSSRYDRRNALCTDEVCQSPMACNGFGYCRSRNVDGPLSDEDAEPFRREWRERFGHDG